MCEFSGCVLRICNTFLQASAAPVGVGGGGRKGCLGGGGWVARVCLGKYKNVICISVKLHFCIFTDG